MLLYSHLIGGNQKALNSRYAPVKIAMTFSVENCCHLLHQPFAIENLAPNEFF